MLHHWSEFNTFFPHVSLLIIALLLGMRHGLDLDHLAIIDAMTRRLPEHSRLSGYVGLLFSAGHGVIVMLLCLLINLFFSELTLPHWLYQGMVGFSISLLIIFGFANLYSLFNVDKTSHKPIFSAKRLFARLSFLNPTKPLTIMAIGGVFAISFDTVSQIALFSLNTTHFFGAGFPVLLGFTFMLGMIMTDGLNGYIVAYFLRKASALSLTLSRLFTVAIGLFSAGIGLYEVAAFW